MQEAKAAGWLSLQVGCGETEEKTGTVRTDIKLRGEL